MLGDFYVGCSKNIHERLLAHQSSIRTGAKCSTPYGLIRYYHRYGFLLVPVNLLSNDIGHESYCIETLKGRGFPLVNQVPGSGWRNNEARPNLFKSTY